MFDEAADSVVAATDTVGDANAVADVADATDADVAVADTGSIVDVVGDITIPTDAATVGRHKV